MDFGKANFVVITCLLVWAGWLQGCDEKTVQKLSPQVHYERDMIVTVNNVTREGQITMPLLDKNKIHVYARGDLDVFLMKTCGGQFKKERAWNVTQTVKSGLFGWGSKKIDKKNEVTFEIDKSDFAETGVCPLYLVGISYDGKHSEAYINWQTPEYQLGGRLVCNMEARAFEGVEVCGAAVGSYLKLSFKEAVYLSPSEGCEIGEQKNGLFEFRANPGVCNYHFEGRTTGRKGMFQVYGYSEIIIRN